MGDLVYQIFIDYVAPVLVSIFMILISVVLKKLLDSLKLNVSKEAQDAMLKSAETLVLAIEERAASSLKQISIGGGDTGAKIDKLATVISLLMKQFPALTEEKAQQIAEAAVAKLPGIGITQLQLPTKTE